MVKRKIGEIGFYNIYEVGWWLFGKRIVYEIDYSRLPLKEICEQYSKLKEKI